jgi:prepilin-type N-terminal cleavage/methylation domain-containing protein
MKQTSSTGARVFRSHGIYANLRFARAFTLIEVMIAMGIFAIGIFSILELVAANLRNARRIQNSKIDAALVLADLYQTNKLVEGEDEGDFGDLYKGYRWRSVIMQSETNGLFDVGFIIIHPNGTEEPSVATQLWRPESTAGANFGTGR